jgi:hypothetical protein
MGVVINNSVVPLQGVEQEAHFNIGSPWFVSTTGSATKVEADASRCFHHQFASERMRYDTEAQALVR